MNIYLLRHGLAVELGSRGFARDSERPLTPKGERKLNKISQAMQALELSFDLILSSPYRRAVQTAQIVAKGVATGQKIQLSDALIPSGSPKKLIEFLNRLDPAPGDVLLVGHEPYLSAFISLLVSGDPGFAVLMKKGGLCKLSAEVLRAGRCACLEWLLTPGQMALMRQ
jgi:phosphohistidine phosphatase